MVASSNTSTRLGSKKPCGLLGRQACGDGDCRPSRLTIADRNFLVADDLTRLGRSGINRHWLTRAKSTTKLRVLRRLGHHDDLVEITLSDQTRRLYPDLPQVWTTRASAYRRKDFRPSMLLTSLLDPDRFPAHELVELYHERWEIELGYNPVRIEMVRVAAEAGVPPNRICIVNAIALIRAAWLTWSTRPLAPGRIPEGMVHLRRDLKLLILPPRRPDRAFPRAVKIKMSSYKRKPPTGKNRK